MDENLYNVRVSRDVSHLVPIFLRTRKRDYFELTEALSEDDFLRISRITHGMVASGTPFGFPKISDFAQKMREALGRRDRVSLGLLIAEYGVYLARVNVMDSDTRLGM